MYLITVFEFCRSITKILLTKTLISHNYLPKYVHTLTFKLIGFVLLYVKLSQFKTLWYVDMEAGDYNNRKI